jgi:perosamine synthetase
LRLIEDSAESLGSTLGGRPCGSFGDAGVFAFYPNKQITTGEGGILVTADEKMARLARSWRNQGRDEMGAWLEHQRLGYNYRMDEMSAALGVSQLERIESHIGKRERVARMYGERLSRFDWVRPPVVRPHVRMSWFVYVATLAEGLDRDPVMAAVEARGVPVRAYFSPIHLQPYIRDEVRLAPVTLPVTEAIARRTIALPFHNNLTEHEVERVVGALAAAVEATRSR